MTDTIVKSIYNIVEAACKGEANIFGYGIWSHHIVKVVEFAIELAERLGADKEAVEIAALLHDYASVSDSGLIEEHHIYGAAMAEKALAELGYPKAKIDLVKDCIISHRGSVVFERKTKEAICIASADAMAHIDQVPSLLYSMYCRRGMGIDDGAIWVREKIARSWDKLCPEAKAMMNDKYKGAMLILQ